MPERYMEIPTSPLVQIVTPGEMQREELSGDELARIQAMIDQLSRWMDSAFEVPGLKWRFGFDAIVGLVPGLGDLATSLVSLYIVTLANRAGVPKITLARMGLNVGVDFVLGSLPLVGDIFDLLWKANQKNATLLRERLAHPDFRSRRATVRDWLFVGAMATLLLALLGGMIVLAVFLASALWAALGRLF